MIPLGIPINPVPRLLGPLGDQKISAGHLQILSFWQGEVPGFFCWVQWSLPILDALQKMTKVNVDIPIDTKRRVRIKVSM